MAKLFQRVFCMCLIMAVMSGARTSAETSGVEKAVETLKLTDDQKRAVDKIVDVYRQKEKRAREELLGEMKKTLTSKQFEELTETIEGSQAEVTFSDGFQTDPRDRGRPVVLIAAALNVPADVFRKAFSGVKPAGPGQQPEPEQVRQNKEALMRALEPYGITNDRLDEVSNYYRYSRSRGEMWRHTPAKALATIRDGVVLRFTIVDGGSGYSSPPTISIAGMPNVKAAATLRFSTDFEKNGSIQAIEPIAPEQPNTP
jgi:hypothetical protein